MDLLAEISQARYGECGAGELMASRRVQRGRCVLRCVTVALRCTVTLSQVSIQANAITFAVKAQER